MLENINILFYVNFLGLEGKKYCLITNNEKLNLQQIYKIGALLPGMLGT